MLLGGTLGVVVVSVVVTGVLDRLLPDRTASLIGIALLALMSGLALTVFESRYIDV